MSSHHFVRDNQEPAVIIADVHFREDLLGSVLEWSPKVVAVGDMAATRLVASSVRVDECYLLEGQPPPTFPYELDIDVIKKSAAEDIVRTWIDKHQQPVYLFGCQNEAIISFFNCLNPALAHLVTAVSEDSKWIYPGRRGFRKWLKKGTSLRMTGQAIHWLIQGQVKIDWPFVQVEKDGLILLETNQLEIFAEPLYL